MYNVPSFTLARTIGGLLAWWWRSVKGWEDTPLIVLASVSTTLRQYRGRLLTRVVPLGFYSRGGLFEHCQFNHAERRRSTSLMVFGFSISRRRLGTTFWMV